MNEKELQDILAKLEEQGWEPLLCDTCVPYYDSPVICGEPMTTYGNRPTEITFPRDMLSMNPEFTIVAKGDSMQDVGIEQGDVLKIVYDECAHDGDIVLASIDGETTIKAYCEDDDGSPWLVPQNSNYEAFPLGGCNCRIVGRVREIIKSVPHVSYRDCMRMINKVKLRKVCAPEISQAQISKTIREIAPMIVLARQWYAVYRAMADLNIVGEGDYDTFIELVKTEVPSHKNLPTRVELQRMALQSFAKPVALWRIGNAPVQGKRFNDYLKIANRTKDLLLERLEILS